jgi:hypothetical protein
MILNFAIAPHFFPDFSAYLLSGLIGKSTLFGLNQPGSNALDLTGFANQIVNRFAVAPVFALDIDLLLKPFGAGIGQGDALSWHGTTFHIVSVVHYYTIFTPWFALYCAVFGRFFLFVECDAIKLHNALC